MTAAPLHVVRHLTNVPALAMVGYEIVAKHVVISRLKLPIKSIKTRTLTNYVQLI